jgi:hypothetical protein
MSLHPATWHDRQLEHVREALAEADKRHTPEEVAAAEAALRDAPGAPQGCLNLISTSKQYATQQRGRGR